MHISLDVTYMHTNFGGCDIYGFGDIAIFKNGEISLLDHGFYINLFVFTFFISCTCTSSEMHVYQVLREWLPLLFEFIGKLGTCWIGFKIISKSFLRSFKYHTA